MEYVRFEDRYILLRTLVTVPHIAQKQSLCTIESLFPVKYQMHNDWYTGPLARKDLVLVSCLNAKYVFKADALSACYSEHNSMLCPDTLLKDADDAQWLGLPWTVGSNLQFERTHVPASCDSLQPIYHLGGRYYLTTKAYNLNLKSRVLQATPLSIYHIPCDESNDLLKTGLVFVQKYFQCQFRSSNLMYYGMYPINPQRMTRCFNSITNQ